MQYVIGVNRQTGGRVDIDGRTPHGSADSDAAIAVAHGYIARLVVNAAYNI